MNLLKIPRILIAGSSGDSGKTVVSLGILANLKEVGKRLAVFKKGPDYIDPMWLSIASASKTRVLDLFLMSEGKLKEVFTANARNADITLIEGNRGLFDGLDVMGICSSAELSVLLSIPVILVLPVTKMTRSASAIVLGFKLFDKRVNIGGVILNFCAGKRHYEIARNSIEEYTGIPVLGCIPKCKDENLMPSRHLGLVTPQECLKAREIINNAKKIIAENIDINKVLQIAESAPNLEDYNVKTEEKKTEAKGIKVGYFYDEAFLFYYVENLEELEKQGAELVKISPLECEELPNIDALYIGGGFPEVYVKKLSENLSFMKSMRAEIERGLPVYAECGGLMYLARDLIVDGITYPLLNVFDIMIKMEQKPVGHGYMEVEVMRENPFFSVGTSIRGHEFHYSRVVESPENLDYCMAVKKGIGIERGCDGLIYKNVLASYLHLHTYSNDEWARNFVNLAQKHSIAKKSN